MNHLKEKEARMGNFRNFFPLFFSDFVARKRAGTGDLFSDPTLRPESKKNKNPGTELFRSGASPQENYQR